MYRYKTTRSNNNLTGAVDKHYVDALLAHENYYNYSYLYGYKTTEIFPNAEEMINFTNITSLYDYQQNYRTESYLGRVRYRYDDKCHGEVSFRDGSSRFHPDHGGTSGIGGNWLLSREEFMEDIDC